MDDWLDSLAHSYAKKSIETYQFALKDLIAFLNQEKIHCWQDCQSAHLSNYFAISQDEKAINIKSLKLRLSAFRLFFKYLIEQGHLSHNPAQTISLKGKSARLPMLLDIDVIYTLLDQPAPTDQKELLLWKRDRAMFELLYSSGLRVAELVGVNMNDIELTAKIVNVTGKGNKQRLVPVGTKAIQAITDYLPVRTLWHKGDPALFISKSGKRLTTRSVQLRLEIWAKRAGIDQALHPHLLRHAFASHLLSSSGDLRAIQEMLGHSNLSTTQIYTHLDFAALAKLYDNTHPRSNLK